MPDPDSEVTEALNRVLDLGDAVLAAIREARWDDVVALQAGRDALANTSAAGLSLLSPAARAHVGLLLTRVAATLDQEGTAIREAMQANRREAIGLARNAHALAGYGGVAGPGQPSSDPRLDTEQ